MKDDFEVYDKKEIINNLYENKSHNIKNNSNIFFFNPINQKEEKYTLLNEEKELLLCKHDILNETIKENNNYNIKIGELFQGKENKNYYYINKEKLKEKYLYNFFELNKNSNDLYFDNQNEEEMNKIYEEITLLHPRKIVNGEIKKYSFWSWTGFFCFKKFGKLDKNEFFNLGFGISSYFKTIKLFILFFFLISCINLICIIHYYSYKSIEGDNILLKTTLSNTKISTYNSIIITKNRSISNLSLNCQDKLIGKFIFGLRNEYLDKEEFNKINNNMLFDKNELILLEELSKWYKLDTSDLNIYNEKYSYCFLLNKCLINNYSLNSDLLYYECINESLLPNKNSENSLKRITCGVTIITLIILIILYFYYKFTLKIDYKEYYKDLIIINNYNLVLHHLKIKSNNYNKEINDLIYHLNTIILDELEKYTNKSDEEESINNSDFIFNNNENNYFNIFDIIISNVNERKIQIFKKIKSLQNKLTDIRKDNDTMKKKIRNSFHKLYKNLIKKKDDNIDSLISSLFSDNKEENILSNEKEDKMENKKIDIKEQIVNITEGINELHKESKQKYYVDIYITFKNPLISNIIYQKYNKNKFQRFLSYLCCNCLKLRRLYYKGQWLNFVFSNNAPSEIQWENCYVSLKTKIKKRCISFFTSFFIIIITTLIIILLKKNHENNDNQFINLIIILICQLVNIFSSIILKKLSKSEKYSTLNKYFSSNIKKYFILNFIISGISINITCGFTYNNFEEYSEVIKCVLFSMFLSIFTAHGAPSFFYLWNLFFKYLDSKCKNGKITKLKNKLKYENLYLGPEFPIDERYSTILVNLTICLLYGSYCPIIYIFFTFFLITTFIIDKYLIINFYKKPPYYNNYLSKKFKNLLFFEIFIFLYGTIYQLSNPYLFNYYQNKSFLNQSIKNNILYNIINPFSIIYIKISENNKIPIIIFNLNNFYLIYVLIFIFLFILPVIILKIVKIFKKRKKVFLNKTPNIDIGEIYSINELNKYYEIKKLELFKILFTLKKNNEKINEYSFLLNNYKNVIDYLKINIDKKNSKKDNKINETEKTNSKEIIFYKKNEENEDRSLIGDTSYNFGFIPNYELYSYFDLLYSI